MNCENFREAVSVVLDGEDPLVPPATLRAHVERCSRCSAFQTRAIALLARTDVAAGETVPDLTPAILAAIGATGETAAHQRAPRVVGDTRLALVAVAIVQLALALPALLLGDPATLGAGDVSSHVARHLGALGAALAAGLLAVAWRPGRADGLLPVAATLVVGLVVASGFDLSAGGALSLGEARHALEIAGLVLVWLLRRETGSAPRFAAA